MARGLIVATRRAIRIGGTVDRTSGGADELVIVKLRVKDIEGTSGWERERRRARGERTTVATWGEHSHPRSVGR